MGPTGKGFGRVCPRDGRPNCSIVDALPAPDRAKATHFVSWCWQYTLEDVTDCLQTWIQESGGAVLSHDVYLWMCYFCNNQYRILEEESTTGSEELKSIFESHLSSAGRMLVILNSFFEPAYFSRAWCLFETFVCIEQEFPRTILLPSRQREEFRHVLETQGYAPIRDRIQQIDLRRAEASVKADEDTIKLMVLGSCGFDVVNQVVQREIQIWLSDAFRRLLGGQ